MRQWKMTLTAVMALTLTVAGCTSPQVEEDEPAAEQPDEPVEQQEDPEAVDQQDDPEADEQPDQQGVMGMIAVAEMYSGDEEPIGQVEFVQTEDGVEVEGQIEHPELADGPRGFHVHEYGECDPPDFESAGAHFNHTETDHGGPDDPHGERHAGDFGNIEFDDEGVAEFSFVDDVITLGRGDNDIVGKALIVHYDEDDLETQPTGDAGARAGCGLIEVARGGVRTR